MAVENEKTDRSEASSLYIYHFSTVVDFSSEKLAVVVLDTLTPGTSREIYSETADNETRPRNPLVINRVPYYKLTIFISY